MIIKILLLLLLLLLLLCLTWNNGSKYSELIKKSLKATPKLMTRVWMTKLLMVIHHGLINALNKEKLLLAPLHTGREGEIYINLFSFCL